ncbi:MAG: biopolymer transporter ExbD [Proteiniphilum sp.]|jgi:biopolymer transport protein ExbD|uniref:ExbD/TolR family protein n=1 Tax=Proteiniphilum sp. TaxID=1926877 RepID=UPI000929ED9A|nr:biopolymer transporter ExbD [Proteiniphilum sp.]MEA5126884.1 biopolymer transporter ExbD [Proteiniphilum sp.]OJV81672.1 MAG: biopolymer transporter ExbD [Bacteroidia bacterium 44-10]
MASIDTGGDKAEKGKPKKETLRVDFTPMVDMNMLLITFFMLVTTLSKPQVMEIAMPTDQKVEDEQAPKVKESKAITLLLGENDKVYYYLGKLDERAYNDYTVLKETTYSSNTSNEGLRSILLERNADAVNRMRELKLERAEKGNRMPEEEFRERSKDIKGDVDALTVIIKPTETSNYKNLVDALDEMQICSVGKYAIVDVTEGDLFLVENYKTQGAFGSANLAPRNQ